MKQLLESWHTFWFAPGPGIRLVPLRLALCCIIAVWFGSFWADVDVWFGESGILSTDLAAKLIAFEEIAGWEYWSPLWWTNHQQLAYAWLVGGVLLSVLTAWGWGGRWTVAILVAWIIAWAHRLVWLTGNVEPAIIAFTAYLIVEPGPSLRNVLKNSSSIHVPHWPATTSLRLLQTHAWILLAATLLSQLAGIVWWRGEAVWWLASASRSIVVSVETLRDRPALVNGLTHAFIAIEIVALWLLLTRGARILGLLFGWLACAAVAWVADYQLYGWLLASGLLAFVDWPFSSTTTSSRE